jgi:serine/threonine protein kinase/tetratricopeptide (TPR) repeat protein
MAVQIPALVFGNEHHLFSQILDDSQVALNNAEDWIGPYRLIRLLGEGGFGQVWLAEQTEPVQREVALKLLKRGMDSDQVLARFNLERQALASMDHSNIASLLNAGSSVEGRPYFVMEYVPGVPVTNWCQEKKLSIRETVGLFQQICSGLQHAHQKGIIHRDLKPANVLVTEVDGVAIPKIIDFGIAKATGEQNQDNPWVTRMGHVMGTPLYMSPEQLAGGSDVDTRSDIYSLGVLFYEMLTGSAPHEGKTHAGMSHEEVRRLMEHLRPMRPSQKLTEIKRARGIVAENAPSYPEHALAIPADLDWIILRALERDRERRYDSAALMGADLKCFLNAEPVTARPPSARYLTSLWIRRNRVIFSAACVCVLALFSGTGVALWQAQEARKAQLQAEAEAQRTLQAVKFLTTMLDRVAEEVANGRNPEALKLALDGSEEKIRQLKGDPLLQSDLFSRVGWLYRTMGERGLAMPLIKAHAETSAAIYGPDSQEAWTGELHYLSQMMQHGARIQVPDLAADLLKRIEAKGQSGSVPWFSTQRIIVQNFGKLRRQEEASKTAHRVLDDPRLESIPPDHRLMLKASCADAVLDFKEYDLAAKVVADCMKICHDNETLRERLPWLEDKQLNIQRSKGDYRRGAELAAQQIARMKETSGDKNPLLVKVMMRLAEFESFSKHHEAALAISRQALKLAEESAPTKEALKKNSKLATLRASQIFAQISVANYEFKAGHKQEAVNMAREACRLADEEGNKSNLAEAMLLLAQMQENTGDLEGAYATYELRGRRSADGGANYQRWHEDLQSRCAIRLKQGRLKEALELAQELWAKEIQSPDAINDKAHLADIAGLALRCYDAFAKQHAEIPPPSEVEIWRRSVK